jgi:hypothetical protein
MGTRFFVGVAAMAGDDIEHRIQIATEEAKTMKKKIRETRETKGDTTCR